MHGIIKHIFDKSIFIISPILSDEVFLFVGDVIGLHAKIKNTPNGVFVFQISSVSPSALRYAETLKFTNRPSR